MPADVETQSTLCSGTGEKCESQSRRYPTCRRFSASGQCNGHTPVAIQQKVMLPVSLDCNEQTPESVQKKAKTNSEVTPSPKVTRNSKRKLSALQNSEFLALNRRITRSALRSSAEGTQKANTNVPVTPSPKTSKSSKKKVLVSERSDSRALSQSTASDRLHSSVEEVEHDSKDAQDDAIATPEQVRGLLHLYRSILMRIIKEEPKLAPNQRRRYDLFALKELKDSVKSLNTPKRYLGNVPGIEIGDKFQYRAELHAVGLHRNLQAGIDCIYYGTKSVASSIISSGSYNDIMDGSGVLLYSGCGGNHDQKLDGGNLALKNCIDAQTPVRVTYGIKEDDMDSEAAKAKKTTTYVYDGLYLVEKYWSEKGSKGYSIFKFRLRRKVDQPKVKIGDGIPAKFSRVQKLLIGDISQGKEKRPVSVVNAIDDEVLLPFTYTTRIIYPAWHKPIPLEGCNCIGGCSDSKKCACVVRNGGEIPFNSEGLITRARPLVYECGTSCKCPPSCQNRVSQHGMKFELEIFKTPSRGWGIRSLSNIPSGSFICEYTGEMLLENEAEKRKNDEYLFDIGKNYNDESLWEGLPNRILPTKSRAPFEGVEEEGFTVDAANFGNVARFINHSCTPNLYAQNVLYDHDDHCMPRVMLFACENIIPFEELTYHYNYSIDRVQGPDGTIRKKECYCGSHECEGRLY